ncbi:alpha/beta hydrolase fold domain-containing protein [Leifsonia poae]|uniref:alpha/beta hydrolase fold domain-containing protein n=1 Tax=Leifsonia poae TaxID=110933 RepID=UPI00403E50AF
MTIAADTRSVTPVPFAAELTPVLDALAANPQPPLSRETLAHAREGAATMFPSAADLIGERPIDVEERVIPGPAGAPTVEITVLSPRGLDRATAGVPALYNIHGGGMIVGHRSWENGRLIDLVAELGVVAVNVEYRLAPEDPFPAGVEDCYAGLVWLSEHAAELGIDPARIVVMGGSAGGGFSAAVSLLARDRRGPELAGQLLLCPMLDNTNTTVSSHQYAGLGTWTREANLLAWGCVLGDDLAFSDAASSYASPTRSGDLTGLPRHSSRWAPPRRSATKTSSTRAESGRSAVRPSCMCGRADSTASTSTPPRAKSRRPPSPRARPGCAASSISDLPTPRAVTA